MAKHGRMSMAGDRMTETAGDADTQIKAAAGTYRLLLGNPEAAAPTYDLDALRPGHGISPLARDEVVGRALVAATPAGTVLEWSMLQ